MQKINLNTVFLYIAILLALIGPLSVLVPLGDLKNLRFLSPILVLPFFTFISGKEKAEILKYFNNLMVIYIIVVIYTLIITLVYHDFGITYRNIVNIVLTLTPLVFSWGIVKYCDKQKLIQVINFLFCSFIILFVVELLKSGISFQSLGQVFQSNIVTESNYDTESGVSLIMGFYYLFYLSRKKYKLALLAAFITILGAKRIAIFGILICTLIYFFYPHRGWLKNKKVSALIFLCVGIIIAIFWDGIITGGFNRIIESYTGLSANRFFMGRLGRFQLVFNEINKLPIFGMGYGLGYMENILYYKVSFASAFHGDFYRIYLEFGAILFAFWLYITGKFSSKNKLALTSSILLILLMQTDNAFLYNRVMFSYYLIFAFAYLNEEKK